MQRHSTADNPMPCLADPNTIIPCNDVPRRGTPYPASKQHVSQHFRMGTYLGISTKKAGSPPVRERSGLPRKGSGFMLPSVPWLYAAGFGHRIVSVRQTLLPVQHSGFPCGGVRLGFRGSHVSHSVSWFPFIPGCYVRVESRRLIVRDTSGAPRRIRILGCLNGITADQSIRASIHLDERHLSRGSQYTHHRHNRLLSHFASRTLFGLLRSSPIGVPVRNLADKECSWDSL